MPVSIMDPGNPGTEMFLFWDGPTKGAAMEKIDTRIQRGEVLVCDGAMGSLLQARGLQPGDAQCLRQ